jgi:hypothetical protein
MFSIKPNQFAEMASAIRKNYQLEIVSDFFALFEQCYQRPSRLDFDEAWRIADYLLDLLEGEPCSEGQCVEYEFIHTVLCATEKGATPEQLHQGVALFCLALPSYEAGLILLDSICALEPDNKLKGVLS